MHQVDDLFAGRYLLAARLGGGGLGEVFRARDMVDRKDVALKIYAPEVGTDAWLRYARVVAAAGRGGGASAAVWWPRLHPAADGEPAYAVAELRSGEDLEALRIRLAPVPGDRVVEIAAGCARALTAMTTATGAAHRALKPGNVWIDVGGEPRVLDHGTAELGAPAVRPRADGTHVEYRAPEQLEGAAGDARSDVFSLAVLMFELLTGVHPYAGPSAFKVAHRVLLQAAPRPTAVAPGVAVIAAVEEVFARAMARAPGERYADVAAFVKALALAERSSVALLPFGDEEPTATAAKTDDASSLVMVAPAQAQDEFSTLLVLKPTVEAGPAVAAVEAGPAVAIVTPVAEAGPAVEAGSVGLLPLPGFKAASRATVEPEVVEPTELVRVASVSDDMPSVTVVGPPPSAKARGETTDMFAAKRELSSATIEFAGRREVSSATIEFAGREAPPAGEFSGPREVSSATIELAGRSDPGAPEGARALPPEGAQALPARVEAARSGAVATRPPGAGFVAVSVIAGVLALVGLAWLLLRGA